MYFEASLDILYGWVLEDSQSSNVNLKSKSFQTLSAHSRHEDNSRIVCMEAVHQVQSGHMFSLSKMPILAT